MKNSISDKNNGYKELGMFILYFPMIISLCMYILVILGILYDHNFFLKRKITYIFISSAIFYIIFYYFYYFQNNTIKKLEINNEFIIITFFRKKLVILNENIICLKKSNYMLFHECINLKTKQGSFKILKGQFDKYDEIYNILTKITNKKI